MNWWTSVVNGAKTIGDGAKWALTTAPAMALCNYVTNTAFYVLEQGLALREAIPDLMTPSSWNIVEGMGQIVFYDVLPVLTVNYVNNNIQDYFREGQEEEQTALTTPYAAFLSLLTVVNYGVQAYTVRQSTNLVLHTLVLDSMGPSVFNACKAKLPPPETLCKEEKCNFKRQFKGSLREPLVLALNDFLLLALCKFPHMGEQISGILTVYFYGEYITRMATPERCERHKAMKSESVLSLGLTYTFTSWLLNQFVESTFGPPPFLYKRTLNHLVLLLHINLAAHMKLPLDRRPKDNIPLNPLIIYEFSRRFIVDVIFAGLMQRVPIDFKPEPGSQPRITLKAFLECLTKIFESDLETIQPLQVGFFRKFEEKSRKTLVPKTFHSIANIVNDPIIKLHWPDIQKYIVSILDFIEQTKPVSALTAGSKPVANVAKHALPQALHLQYGLSIGLGEFLVRLSKKEEFWQFVSAFKLWTIRNTVSHPDILIKARPNSTLLHREQLLKYPTEKPDELKSAPSAQDLFTLPTKLTAPKAQQLMPVNKPPVQAPKGTSLFNIKKPTVSIDEVPENKNNNKAYA